MLFPPSSPVYKMGPDFQDYLKLFTYHEFFYDSLLQVPVAVTTSTLCRADYQSDFTQHIENIIVFYLVYFGSYLKRNANLNSSIN